MKRATAAQLQNASLHPVPCCQSYRTTDTCTVLLAHRGLTIDAAPKTVSVRTNQSSSFLSGRFAIGIAEVCVVQSRWRLVDAMLHRSPERTTLNAEDRRNAEHDRLEPQ